jgi:hypothetical protein
MQPGAAYIVRDIHTQRVQEQAPRSTLVRRNLATRPTDVTIQIKRLPEMIQTLCLWPSPDVNQDTHIWRQERRESVECPSVAINFSRILLFQTKEDLTRHDASIWVSELQAVVERERGGIFETVSSDGPVLYGTRHCPFLVDTQCGETVEHPGVDLFSAVRYDAHDNLPSAYARNWRGHVRDIPFASRLCPRSCYSYDRTDAQYCA